MSDQNASAARGRKVYPSGVLEAVRSPAILIREILAGTVTALALIPEVISFSFISGVDPKVALVASITLGLVMSAIGGRPGMVTAAAGSVALVIGPMVKVHGVGYILPAVILAGLIQIALGLLGFARLMRFVPRSVMIGFVNSLGILIFFAQIPHLINVPLAVYPLFMGTVAIVLLAPRFTEVIPAPLIAICVVTVIAVTGHLHVPSVGGDGSFHAGFFRITRLDVPLSFETLSIVWPTALSVAFVGLLETLLTAKLVDELTDTKSHKGQEAWALGIANIVASFLGGIAGCAMIGQTIVNVKIADGRTRISTAAAALALLLLVTGLSEVMTQIPMVALAAIMMIVAIRTFSWHSVAPSTLRRMPVSENLVLFSTTAATVATGNLAIGVAGGVLLAMVLFTRRVAHVITVDRKPAPDGASVRYEVRGPLFFGSSNDLAEQFSYATDPSFVTVDFTHSQIWDASSVATLDSIETKYKAYGRAIEFTGFDNRSQNFHGRLTGTLTGAG
ncbi:MAG: SulP family inorganic anion transporter [Bradyrhizobiaceae bacterium]|nr:MAG: SulP family inorganic anion transporter [Bradyrhizobiaceae bacterium]